MKNKIDRMSVAQCILLVAGTIGVVNEKCLKSKALAVLTICLASGAIALTVEDMALSFVKES